MRLDLLIIDIDDTFIYHRTVASANQAFLTQIFRLFRLKLKKNRLYKSYEAFKIAFYPFKNLKGYKYHQNSFYKLIRLVFSAIVLYSFNIFREIWNSFGKTISNSFMIKYWAYIVTDIQLKKEIYEIKKDVIQKNLNKPIVKIYNLLKKNNPKIKVLALSQHFIIKDDPIKVILDIDYMLTNKFNIKNNRIVSAEINIKNGFDKLKIAKKYSMNKSIGLIIEDYDDIYLLKLKNIEYVLCKNRLKRFIDVNKFTFKKGPNNFIICQRRG